MTKPYPARTLIDPQARVIDLTSSTRSLKLIHRALLSHLSNLSKNPGSRIPLALHGEPFEVEYNSTAQLAEDIGNYISSRMDA